MINSGYTNTTLRLLRHIKVCLLDLVHKEDDLNVLDENLKFTILSKEHNPI